MTDYYSRTEPNKYSHSWAHFAVMEGVSVSKLGDILELVALDALEKSGQQVDKILRVRLGLHSISPESFVGGPHVDLNYPHMVALIYLTDSDGDTIIYNEKYQPSNLSTYEYYEQVLNSQVTEAARSTPEENKMIWFDGGYYHSSSNPTTVAKRIVMNINYTLK